MKGISFTATRLAPSPTGALHLGHARTFLVNWWLARQAGAKIYMRMEDLDAGRAKPESVQQAYDDLRWLGIDWDDFAGEGEVVQSRRMEEYEAALQRLWANDAVYPCTCTRADIVANVAAAGNAPHEGEGNVRYPGTCAGKTQIAKFKTQNVREVMHAAWEETGKAVCWRLRVPEGRVEFEDAVAGPQAFDVMGEVGEFPVTRFVSGDASDPIPPAYQLACVVDDHAMGIDLVVRGDDLLPSTPRQMLVYRALGWDVPRFAHVPLVVGADGKRLAKRHGESRIAQFRAAGVSAERIVGWAAWRGGQIEKPREMSAAEMIGSFDVEKLPRKRVVLGEEDFAWLR